jgi:hypothetical protein
MIIIFCLSSEERKKIAYVHLIIPQGTKILSCLVLIFQIKENIDDDD